MKHLSKELLVRPGSRIKLADLDPSDTHGIDKADAAAQLEKNLERLSVLQYLLYAEARRAIAGRAAGHRRRRQGWHHPTRDERAQSAGRAGHVLQSSGRCREAARLSLACPPRVPEFGQIGIFNRSHYEDVLVVRVHSLVPKSVWSKRYAQINDFERMLSDNGTRIVKFLLYIDKDEQAKRFRERIEDKTKNWKFSPADLKEREYWDQYIAAYEDMLRKCSTEYAPWYVIPANRKWFRNLAVSQILREELEAMSLKYPKPVADLSDQVRIRRLAAVKGAPGLHGRLIPLVITDPYRLGDVVDEDLTVVDLPGPCRRDHGLNYVVGFARSYDDLHLESSARSMRYCWHR